MPRYSEPTPDSTRSDGDGRVYSGKEGRLLYYLAKWVSVDMGMDIVHRATVVELGKATCKKSHQRQV